MGQTWTVNMMIEVEADGVRPEALVVLLELEAGGNFFFAASSLLLSSLALFQWDRVQQV